MDKNGVIAVIFVFAFVSSTCDASLAFHLRKLIANEAKIDSITPQVSPTGSPVNESNTNPINSGKSQEDKQKESQKGNENNSNNRTSPIDSKEPKKNDNDGKISGNPSPLAGEKNGTKLDSGAGKAANASNPKLDNNGSCEGSLSCRVQEMLACIEVSKHGSKELFLLVKNDGESTLKVNVNSPDHMRNDSPALEVPKHKTRRVNVSSIVGKSTELTVSSGSAKCVLHLVNPVSVDNLVRQLSFYSKQVSPIYAVYGSFLLALLLGGTWACCKLRKRNQQDGIPYQELEMGLPESASAANADAAEGWDEDWDDDWDDDNAVKSPAGHQVRSISADGLTSRPNKKD